MLFCAVETNIAMAGMRSRAGVGAVALALVVAANGAVAAPRCANSDEVTAIQAAAIQQQLMVAALTCNQVDHFNSFQTSFGKELRRSDAALQHMFRRLYAGHGDAEYHAFKTRLANNSSIRSIHDNTGYCHDAGIVFEAALIQDKPTLASFVSGIEVTEQGPIGSCGMSVAVGFSGMPTVAPKPNPMRMASAAPPPPPAAPAPTNN
jgi:hypothetical protein